MPVVISQLRPEELQSAVDFAKTVGCDAKAESVDPQVSLLARDGETIVAAVLGIKMPSKSCEIRVCFGNTESHDGLMRDLIDKALMKVNGQGIRRCQINQHGNTSPEGDWPAANWIGDPDASAKPDVSVETDTSVEPDASVEPDEGTQNAA